MLVTRVQQGEVISAYSRDKHDSVCTMSVKYNKNILRKCKIINHLLLDRYVASSFRFGFFPVRLVVTRYFFCIVDVDKKGRTIAQRCTTPRRRRASAFHVLYGRHITWRRVAVAMISDVRLDGVRHSRHTRPRTWYILFPVTPHLKCFCVFDENAAVVSYSVYGHTPVRRTESTVITENREEGVAGETKTKKCHFMLPINWTPVTTDCIH
jgi:hypothetical protein